MLSGTYFVSTIKGLKMCSTLRKFRLNLKRLKKIWSLCLYAVQSTYVEISVKLKLIIEFIFVSLNFLILINNLSFLSRRTGVNCRFRTKFNFTTFNIIGAQSVLILQTSPNGSKFTSGCFYKHL